jgi:hypothetical protein
MLLVALFPSTALLGATPYGSNARRGADFVYRISRDSTAGPAHEKQMLSTSRLFARDYPPSGSAADIIRDHRARVAIETEERLERRRVEQAEQSASASTAEARIRAWEKVHGLRLPSDAAHAIVTLVATETHLTVAEVWEEQSARKAARRRRA